MAARNAQADAPQPRDDIRIAYRDPRELIPYERNARTHSPAQIEQIQASIVEFGFTNPVLLKDDDRTIGAGHARTLAALALGLERIPTITLPGLTEAQWRAYVLADNKLALNSGWDDGLLKLELGELQGLGVDMELIGFSPFEVTHLFDGWSPNMEAIDRVAPDGSPLLARIVVECKQEQRGEIEAKLRAALEGVEGVTLG